MSVCVGAEVFFVYDDDDQVDDDDHQDDDDGYIDYNE